MILKEFKTFFGDVLSKIYPKTEIDSFFFILVEEILNLKRIDTVLNSDLLIDNEKLSELKAIITRLKNEEPIQYILGKTEFFGYPFLVNKNTLIPRPETEELVEWILLEIRENRIKSKDPKLTFLDIGTGSGCIPISLAKNLSNAEISAVDISSEALKIAKQNAILNKVTIDFIEIDILKTTSLNVIAKAERLKQCVNENNELPKQVLNDISFDIIVSNPPYVRELEKVEIKNNVLENEPHLALFVTDNNPLLFYDKIADLAKNHLNENGILFFEINQYLGKETVAMLQGKGFKNIELKKDLFGNNRMIKTQLK